MSGRRLPVILALGTAQTLAWASSVYLPAILADPIAQDLGISANWIFAAYSGALVIAGLLGPRIGRQIDRLGGRPVLSLSNLAFACGLVLLGFTHSILMLMAAWLLLGIGMGYGLYDAAFGALGRAYGAEARGAITGITLMAGFASTIGWPLTAYGLAHIGWRDTCLAWAAAHILIGLPLNVLMFPRLPERTTVATSEAKPQIPIDRTMVLLAVAFALVWIVTGAMAAQLPRILEASGASHVQAIAAGALLGPAQVLARLFEIGFLSRYHPIVSAKLAFAMHPLGALFLALTGGAGASVFALFHGAGNGVVTIARGTLPLAIFGPKNYAYRLGLLGAPARMAQAPAPLIFGFLIDWMGGGVLIVSSVLCLMALGALFLLDIEQRRS